MNKKLTLNDCNDEIVRIARLLVFSKCDKSEEDIIKKQLQQAIIARGEVEKRKNELAEQRRADREAKKLGIRR